MQFHSPRDRLDINVWPWLLAAGLPVIVLGVLTAYYVNRSQEASRLPTVPARPPAAMSQGEK
jgi:hypothetical protein